MEKRKYKVEFVQTETFIVDVYADDDDDAIEKAQEQWYNGNYQETCDTNVEPGAVYDVTDTDDPFNPM